MDINVEASGDLDLRGTMGIDETAPVGFEDISVEVSVGGDLEEDTQQALQKYTEKYCTVYQTLVDPSAVQTNWTFQ